MSLHRYPVPSRLEIHFSHGGCPQSKRGGERFAAPREHGFRDTPTAEMLDLLDAIGRGQPWRAVVAERFAVSKPWLHSIITSAARTAFFETVLPPGSGPVMDLGAGWGQVARPLAQNRPVVAVEPVSERLDFIEASAQQDEVHDHIT